jgi:hypothetical protein
MARAGVIVQSQVYSVWDWRSGMYAYFSGGRATERPLGPTVRGLGLPPEDIAPRLPRDARFSGYGPSAVGMIAVMP